MKSFVTPVGLRKVTDTPIADEEAFIQFALVSGYDDLVETVRRPVKSAIRARIEDGEEIPGCELRVGDVATYTVDRALLREARESAAGD